MTIFPRRLDDLEARGSERSLVDTVRFAIADVSFLTGAADQTAFTRAFRRWTGQTPAAYRSASTV